MSGLSRRAVTLPLGGALALPLLATPVLDRPGWPDTVLRGSTLLVAVAAAGVVDEAEARLLDASPTSFARRVLRRATAFAALALPVLLLAAWWATRWTPADVVELVRDLAALCVAAVAGAAALRRWGGLAEPAVVAGPLLVAGLLLARAVAGQLPGAWSRDVLAVAALVGGPAALAVMLRDPATSNR